MKTLNDFKEQIARDKGFNGWTDTYNRFMGRLNVVNIVDILHEAAELYATHREEEGRKEGWEKGSEAQQLIDIKIQEMGWEYKGPSRAEYQPVIK